MSFVNKWITPYVGTAVVFLVVLAVYKIAKPYLPTAITNYLPI